MARDGVSLMLEELRRAISELRGQRLLYHYTNAAGLEGILSSHVIRASNYRFVNDASELRFGRSAVSGVLDSLIVTFSHRKRELHEVREMLQDGWRDVLDREVLDVYITSFCGDVDRLSQWRAYGSRSGRYAIAVEVRRLDGVGLFWPLRVLYQPDEQRQSVVTVVERILAAADAGQLSISDVDFALKLKLFELSCRIKHQAFREENEWRSIIDASDYDTVELIRFPPHDVTFPRPFVELLRGSSEGRRLPITAIYVGPSLHQSSSVRFARDLLKRHGYDGVEVIVSEIPLAE